MRPGCRYILKKQLLLRVLIGLTSHLLSHCTVKRVVFHTQSKQMTTIDGTKYDEYASQLNRCGYTKDPGSRGTASSCRKIHIVFLFKARRLLL